MDVENLKETLKLKETRNATTQARLRNQVKSLEKDNGNLKEELDKLTKLNAKLQANQRVNRRPSDTKMLHEINKNLTKLTKTNSKNSCKTVNKPGKKVQAIEEISSSSENSSDGDDDEHDSLKEENDATKKTPQRKSCNSVMTEKSGSFSRSYNERVKETAHFSKENSDMLQHTLRHPSTIYDYNQELTPPLTLRQRKGMENCENDRNTTNIETRDIIKSYNDLSLERNYEKIFAEANVQPRRLSNNSLNETQKNGKFFRFWLQII